MYTRVQGEESSKLGVMNSINPWYTPVNMLCQDFDKNGIYNQEYCCVCMLLKGVCVDVFMCLSLSSCV